MENQNPVYSESPDPANSSPQPSPQPTFSDSNQNQTSVAFPKKSPTKRLLWILLAVAIFIVAIYITYMVSTVSVITKLDKAYTVDGSSMAPTLNNGEGVLVANYNILNTKLLNNSVTINDLVVFNTTIMGRPSTLIKRVVAVGGQRVVIANNRLSVYDSVHPNGFDPTIAYEPNGEVTTGSVDIVVPNENVYVLGDNRSNSLDSRVLGPIAESALIGKVIGKITQP